jgi:uncharacterized protein YbbK (DUF523 family)
MSQTEHKIRIGISSCLLGNAVRYDGDHSRNDLILETLGPHVEFVPICPEVAIGMGVPRKPIQLVRFQDNGKVTIRALVVENPKVDVTEQLQQYARELVMELSGDKAIQGFIFKAKSPSCGVGTTKVFADGKLVLQTGTGIFARMLCELIPGLPVVDDSRLDTVQECEAFLTRVCGLQFEEKANLDEHQ